MTTSVTNDELLVVSNNQTSNGLDVLAGGTVVVSSGGTADGAVIEHGGSMNVVAGGVASGTVVSSGGDVTITVADAVSWHATSANVISGVTIDRGAIVDLQIAQGGSVSGLVLGDFGFAFVSSGGAVSRSVVSSGALEVVNVGGSAISTTIDSGGAVDIVPGAVTTGTALAAGGVIILDGNATAATATASGLEVALLGGGELLLSGKFPRGTYVVGSDTIEGGTDIALKPSAPALTATATVTVGVGQVSPVSKVQLAQRGSFQDEIFTVTLTDAQGGLLSALGASAAGANLTLSGTLATVNAELATLTDRALSTGIDKITVHASDEFGSTAPQKIITVRVNGPPAIANPASASVVSTGFTTIKGISIAEPGAPGTETFTVTLADQTDSIEATGKGVIRTGSMSSLTITGSLAQVNADLKTVKIEGAPDTLTVTATDAFGSHALPIEIPLVLPPPKKGPVAIDAASLQANGTAVFLAPGNDAAPTHAPASLPQRLASASPAHDLTNPGGLMPTPDDVHGTGTGISHEIAGPLGALSMPDHPGPQLPAELWK